MSKIKTYKRYSGFLFVNVAWRNGTFLVHVGRKKPSAGQHVDIPGPNPYEMTSIRANTLIDVIAAQAIMVSTGLRADADRDGAVSDWRSYIITRRNPSPRKRRKTS